MLNAFITNALDLHYWTLKSCFGAFLSDRVHFGPFRYCTKLGAKQGKLVQLMLSCHDFTLEFFATNAPDPHHWTLNSCFGAFLSVQVHFEIVSLLHETWCKTRQTGAITAKVRATMSC